MKAVQQIKNRKNKAVGPDLVSYKDIHGAVIEVEEVGKSNRIIDAMWKLFNGWVERGIPIPEGRIVMIEKADGSGRPILVQNAIWNVFQLILKNKLLEAVNHDYDVLYGRSQKGYRQGVSSTECLQELIQIANSTARGTIVAMDASKAFDRIFRKVIIEELEKLSIDRQLRSVLQRSVELGCRVVNGGGVITNRGVPQGGIMSGLLYNLGLRGLDDVVDCALIRYADDIHLVQEEGNNSNEEKITEYQVVRGIDNNASKTKRLKVADPKRGELVSLGKTIISDGSKVDIFCGRIPESETQLRINSKLNPVQKIQVYKSTTIARWAYGLEITNDLNLANLDSQMRGKIKQLLNVGMHLETKFVMDAIGNKYMPSYFLVKRARNAALKFPNLCPPWATGNDQLVVKEPHPLLNNPYGKLLLLLRDVKVAQDAECPLCGEEEGSTVDHIFSCSATPDVKKLQLRRESFMQQATNEALYLLGATMNKRKETLRAKNPIESMSHTQKVFREEWYAALKAGKTTSKSVMEYIMLKTDYNNYTLQNLRRWFIENNAASWQQMEEALRSVIEAQRRNDSNPEQEQFRDWVRQVEKAKNQALLGLVIRSVLSAHRTSGVVSRDEVKAILKVNDNELKDVRDMIKTGSKKSRITTQRYPLSIRATVNPAKSGAGIFPVPSQRLMSEIKKAAQQKACYKLTAEDPLLRETLLKNMPAENTESSSEIEEERNEANNNSSDDYDETDNNEEDIDDYDETDIDAAIQVTSAYQPQIQTPLPQDRPTLRRSVTTPTTGALSFMQHTTSRQRIAESDAKKRVLERQNLQRQNSATGNWKR